MVIVLSFGEAIWSPRCYDYTMSIAPEVSTVRAFVCKYVWECDCVSVRVCVTVCVNQLESV